MTTIHIEGLQQEFRILDDFPSFYTRGLLLE